VNGSYRESSRVSLIGCQIGHWLFNFNPRSGKAGGYKFIFCNLAPKPVLVIGRNIFSAQVSQRVPRKQA